MAADRDLRHEVESLLVLEGAAAQLMNASALDLVAAINGDEPVGSMVGRRIGAYEVIEEIGHGGMGEVYLARRADDEYQKRVAIKLIKRGIDTGLRSSGSDASGRFWPAWTTRMSPGSWMAAPPKRACPIS